MIDKDNNLKSPPRELYSKSTYSQDSFASFAIHSKFVME